LESTDVRNNTMRRNEILEDWKTRLSLLWVVGWLIGIVGNMLELYEPGVIEEIIGGV